MIEDNILESEIATEKCMNLLELYELSVLQETGVKWQGGGYANARYDKTEDGVVFFTVKWGIEADDKHEENTDFCTIKVADLMSDKTAHQCIDYIKG